MKTCMMLSMTVASVVALAAPAIAAPLLGNAVAIGAVSVVASSNYGAPWTTDRTIDQSDLSGSYVSGVTSTAVIDGFSNIGTGAGWHGALEDAVGTIVFDLGATYTLDRVYLFWMNGGATNNIASFSIDVSGDAGFGSFATMGSFGVPSAAVNRIDFNTLGTGQYVRLSWTALQGDYPGLNEFIAGGISASGAVPEPASWALLIAGFGLTGAAMRRRRSAATPAR